jgi:hypothetical protein
MMIKYALTCMAALSLPAIALANIQSEDNKAATRDSAKPVAVIAVRATVVPRAEDVALLRDGLALMISSNQNGMTIVKYHVVDGKIVYTVTTGTVSEKDRKAIDKAVAKMQKRL